MSTPKGLKTAKNRDARSVIPRALPLPMWVFTGK
jgi:hypothetical protein